MVLLINKWILTLLNAKGQVPPRQALIKEYHDSKCHIHRQTVKVSIIRACKSRTEQQATQGIIHPNAPPIPPLSSDTKWCRAVTLVFRLEWSRQPSRAASHSHRAGRLPVTDARRGSLPPGYCSISRTMLAELRQQSARRRAVGDPSATEVRDGGGIFTLWVRLWPDDSSLPGNSKINIRQGSLHNKNSTARNKNKRHNKPNTLSEMHFV